METIHSYVNQLMNQQMRIRQFRRHYNYIIVVLLQMVRTRMSRDKVPVFIRISKLKWHFEARVTSVGVTLACRVDSCV